MPRVKCPVPLGPRSVAIHRQPVGGRKPQDLFVEGDLFVLEQRDEVSRYPSLVQPPWYVSEREQPLDL